jgi:hypothetical protein
MHHFFNNSLLQLPEAPPRLIQLLRLAACPPEHAPALSHQPLLGTALGMQTAILLHKASPTMLID